MSKSDFLDIKEARTHAQNALNAMSRHGVPPGPRNFEIWFAYATGTSPELTAEIDQIIEEDRGFTDDANRALYDRHIIEESNNSEADERSVITSELLYTLRSLQAAFDDSETGHLEFHEKLGRYAEQLETAEKSADIGRIVSEMIIDTAQIREQTDGLKAKLADSSARISQLDRELATTGQEAITDLLTGIANRRHFEREFEKAVADAERSALPLSLIYLDIDRFKDFNDKHGHHTGDVVLRLVAGQIDECVGEGGMACRYGGEEFVVLLKDTDAHTALVMAEKIRILISRKEVTHRKSRKSFGRITISCGLTLFRPGEDSASFLRRADRLLYEAKEAGRNCVMQSRPDDETLKRKSAAS